MSGHISYLSAPSELDCLALSSSSSSSTSASSLFCRDGHTSSDSQTDVSPPHSPLKDGEELGDLGLYPLPQTYTPKALLDISPITPKQNRHLVAQDEDDAGYHSELEGKIRLTVNRIKSLTRKRGVSERYRPRSGLSSVSLSPQSAPTTVTIDMASPVRSFKHRPGNRPRSSSPLIRPSDSIRLLRPTQEPVGLGLGLPTAQSFSGEDRIIKAESRSGPEFLPPPKPMLLPTLLLDEPSPIIALPSLQILSSPSIIVCPQPRRAFKPRLDPTVLLDLIDPIEALPSPWDDCAFELDDRPSQKHMIRPEVEHSASAASVLDILGKEQSDIILDCEPPEAVIGLGLGLPSTFSGRQDMLSVSCASTRAMFCPSPASSDRPSFEDSPQTVLSLSAASFPVHSSPSAFDLSSIPVFNTSTSTSSCSSHSGLGLGLPSGHRSRPQRDRSSSVSSLPSVVTNVPRAPEVHCSPEPSSPRSPRRPTPHQRRNSASHNPFKIFKYQKRCLFMIPESPSPRSGLLTKYTNNKSGGGTIIPEVETSSHSQSLMESRKTPNPPSHECDDNPVTITNNSPNAANNHTRSKPTGFRASFPSPMALSNSLSRLSWSPLSPPNPRARSPVKSPFMIRRRTDETQEENPKKNRSNARFSVAALKTLF